MSSLAECGGALLSIAQSSLALDDSLAAAVIEHAGAFISGHDGADSMRYDVETAVAALTAGPVTATSTQWLSFLGSVCTQMNALKCSDAAILEWLWGSVFQLCGHAFKAQHDILDSSAADQSPPHGVSEVHGAGAGVNAQEVAVVTAAAAKQAITTCATAVGMLGPLVDACAAAGAAPTPSSAAYGVFLCRVAAELFSLDAYVKYNFTLKNLLWKSLSQLCAQAGAAFPADDDPQLTTDDDGNACISTARVAFADIVGCVLDHMDECLPPLFESVGEGSDVATFTRDGKTVSRHTKILRFFCAHVSAFFKHGHLLARIQPQLIRFTLTLVRVRQMAFAVRHHTTGAASDADDTQSVLAQFVVPVLTDCLQRCVTVDELRLGLCLLR